MAVWIYHDTTADQLVGFGSFDEAATWIEEHDPEGAAFGYDEYDIVPFASSQGIDWRTLLKDGEPVWHGPEQACLQFVADPAFREECLRSRKLHGR